MDALSRAFSDGERSYLACKASLANSPADSLLATAGGGMPGMLNRSNMGRAAQQLKAYRGWSYVAIRCVANRIAGQAVNLFRVTGKKSPPRAKQAQPSNLEPIEQHDLLTLLADPNPLGTRWTFLYSTVCNILLSGKAFWWLTEDEVKGKPALYWLPSSWVEGYEGSSRITSWSVRPPGMAESFPIPAEDMTYFHTPDPSDPSAAVSPLMACSDAVEADQYITASQRGAFSRGMYPSMALIVGKHAGPDGSINCGARPQLSGAQRKQLIRAVRNIWSQTIHQGDPLILDGLVEDVKRLQAMPNEMDWIESGKALRERILMSYSVNGIVAGQVESANRASSTEAERHFVNNAVNPLAVAMSEAMTEWIGQRFSTEGEKLVLQIEPCVVHDEDLEMRKFQLLAQSGAISADELRAWAGLPKLPHGLGGLPIPAPSSIQDALERTIDAGVMVTGRMIAQQEVEKLRRSNGRTHAGS